MSMIGVDYGVLNQRGSPSWFSDIYANIPTAGYKGRMFISTDTFAFYRDTGTGWDLIGGPGTGTITGSGASGQVSYFNGSSTLAGSNNLFWDSTNNRLGIGTATPGVALDIHATGTNAQFNGTGTNNAYLVFQNSGTSKWRIGNTYNTGNSFDLYNNSLTTNALSINSTTNTATFGTNIIANGWIQTGTNTSTMGGGLSMAIGNGTNTYTGQSNSISIYAPTNSQLFFVYGNGTSNKLVALVGNPTDGNQSYYNWPSATTGTLALTSNLNSYLPLAGGTMSGSIIIENGLGTNQIYLSKGSGDVYGTIQTEAGGNKFSLGNVSNIGTLGTPNITWTSGMQVGINNSSPTYDFDVTGTGRFTGILRLGSTLSNGTYFYTLPSATGTLALTSQIPTISGTTNTLAKFTSSSAIGNSMVSDDGTTLTSTGATRSNLYIKAANNTYYGQLAFTNGTNALYGGISYNNSGQYMQFETNTSEWMRLNSNGNFLIGTTTDAGYKLDINGTGRFISTLITADSLLVNATSQNGTASKIYVKQSSDSAFRGINIVSSTSAEYVGGMFMDGTGNFNIAQSYLGSGSYQSLAFLTSGTERLRISNVGKIMVNTTDTGVNALLYSSASSSEPYPIGAKATTSSQGLIGFFDNANNLIGSISYNGSLVLYNGTSDYRLKEDFKDYNGLNIIKSIKTYNFKWKQSNANDYGVIAHELQEILPNIVTGKKDALDKQNNILPQGVDYSKLVPILIKSIQELNEKLIRNNIN